MYTTNRALPRKLLSIAMALAMALTMTVSAFASDLRPWYADETTIKATINVSAQTYLRCKRHYIKNRFWGVKKLVQ